VVGDELVAGVGDPRAIGWVGRVAAQTPVNPPAQYYQLAVPMETSSGLLRRWSSEVGLRFLPGHPHRLVIAPGTGDLSQDISLARSRLNLANVLDEAVGLGYQVAVVGPPPGGPLARVHALEELNRAFEDVAGRRDITYVDTYTPLLGHEQWIADMSEGDGYHPGQAGYGLIAWLVIHAGWEAWLKG
jgi:lysophospholipase L1-like esterase